MVIDAVDKKHMTKLAVRVNLTQSGTAKESPVSELPVVISGSYLDC